MTKQPRTRIHSIVPMPNNGGFLERTAQPPYSVTTCSIDDSADSSPFCRPFPVVGDGGDEEEDRSKSHGCHAHEDGKQLRRPVPVSSRRAGRGRGRSGSIPSINMLLSDTFGAQSLITSLVILALMMKTIPARVDRAAEKRPAVYKASMPDPPRA